MFKSIRAIMILLTLALFLGACVPAAQPAAQQPAQNAQSASDIQSQINTSVAQTVEAQNQVGTFVAQTMEAQATATPSATPFSLPTFTPFVVSTATNRPSGGGGGGSGGSGGGGLGSGGAGSPQYDCDVVFTQPGDGDRIWKPGDSFDVEWTLKNTGTKTIPADAYFVFRDYTNYSPTSGFVLGHAVEPGDKFKLRIEAVAPAVVGTEKEQFTMRWTLIVLGNKLCNPYTSIFVQKQ